MTALRLDIERVRPGPDRDRLLNEVDALEAAINEVIRAARSSSAKAEAGPIDLAASTKARLLFWSVLAENQRRPMTVTFDDVDCPVALTTEALDAAIDALVGNVFAHTPEGTGFHVKVRSANGALPPAVIVDDDGPGVADLDLVERGASGAGSTGLGLDIAGARPKRREDNSCSARRRAVVRMSNWYSGRLAARDGGRGRSSVAADLLGGLSVHAPTMEVGGA